MFVLYSADYDKYSEDPEFKPASRHAKDLFEEVRIGAFTLKSFCQKELIFRDFWEYIGNKQHVIKPVNESLFNLVYQPDSMNVDDEISVEDKAGPVLTETLSSQSGASNWPSSSSLTARLRRLITAYQRSYRQEQLKIEAEAKGDRRRRRCEQASKLKEIARQERQQRYACVILCSSDSKWKFFVYFSIYLISHRLVISSNIDFLLL